jgi:hypothetical protein
MDLPIDAFLAHHHLPPSTPETINPILDFIEAYDPLEAYDLIARLYPQLSNDIRDKLLYFLTELLNPIYTYDYISIGGSVYRTDTQLNPNPAQSAWQRLDITPYHQFWEGVSPLEIDSTPEFLTYYNQQLQETELYRCGVDGTCQRDFAGVLLQECQATCEASSMIPDLYYNVLSYDPGSALNLPLKDQVRVARNIVGYTIPVNKVNSALRALNSGEWHALIGSAELQPYLKTKYGVVEYALRMITYYLGLNEVSINYNALKVPFTEAVRAFRTTGDRGVFRKTVLGLFYKPLVLAPTDETDLLNINLDDDPSMNIEKFFLFSLDQLIDGSDEGLLDGIV